MKRIVAAVATAALGTSLLALPSSPIGATATVAATARFAGADRYATTNAVANDPIVTNQTKFVLASGTNFADGLAASALAGALGNASLLLTPPDALPASVLATLTSMSGAQSPKYVVIVGGVNAVSANIAAQLASIGYTVSRVAGTDRYSTADAVAASVKLNNSGAIGTFGGYRTAFLANGKGFADALGASGVAYKLKLPIFLTDGTTLSAGTAAAMTAAGVQQVIVLGGTAAVSDDVKSAVDAVTGVITTSRIGGADRYETATLFASTIGAAEPAFLTRLILVSGTDFPDALAASQLASDDSASIIPVTDPLPASVSAFIAANSATIATIETIGGTAAVSAATVTAAAAAATLAKPTATIVALDGSATATVTFSAPLTDGAGAAGAEVLTSYTRTNAAGVTTYAHTGGVAYTYNATTGVSQAIVTFAAPVLAPNDTIRVLGFSIAHLTNSTTVAGASATVAVDASVPSATLVAYPGAAAATQKVWVTFSANTLLGSFVGTTDLVHTPAVLGGTPAAFNACAQVSTSQTYTCDIATGTIAAGETVTLKAGSISSKASTPVLNTAAASATATADITPPVLQSARYSTSAVGGVQASLTTSPGTTAGAVTVTARAGTAAAGNAGNAWSLKVTDAEGATAVSVNSTTKVVTVTANLTPATITAINVADALNGNAAFSALFIASVAVSANMDGTVTTVAPLTGGTDLLTAVATFNEPLSAAVAGNFSFSNTVIGTALTANAVTNAGLLTGVLTLTAQTADTFVAGVSTITTAVGVTDRSSLAATAGATLTVAMYPS